MENLNCLSFFDASDESIKDYVKNRTTIEDPVEWSALPMDCDAIKERNYFQIKHLFYEETEFPIAFVRAVFKVG